MKLLIVVLFSTLIWPSPFMQVQGKKINHGHKIHRPEKVWHAKSDHSMITHLKQ